ncbi:TPA: AAA family ATPase [Pseudomonas aeruginosa]|uniref:AAA family ATPase n=1 Tax=Pseudomonas aeruginosa TaxID=287 RepID=UPI00071B4FE8|nr:AAA family ATPase [Pseudomonas aeruginosa]KSD17500.1 ATPase [Pseudomonas aeruginosa]MBG5825024.1 AAA family ATPase [Pseudomonas aeruginosa]HBO8980226.1 AAA family ATPase [Pseudomonas aeruginosa]HCL3876964.1 AAA family ATPase [Pseudomonas aeruginosa]HEO1562248.1 AAA family ATPase [Pseudomonas aeruginosa]
MKHFVILSGCSGGGKSTLLSELHQRGHAVVEEPGQRIVQEETRIGGQALPWIDMTAFLRRAIDMALDDHANARHSSQWTFFDRGLIDAASALEELTGEPLLATLGQTHRYHPQVFLVPPWPEIYATDAQRRHSMDVALVEYERLQRVYPSLGYEVTLLPKVDVVARADFVLSTLAKQ